MDMLEDENTAVFVAEGPVGLSAYGVMRMCETPPGSFLVGQKYAFVDDLCVREDLKGNGIGTALFNYLAEYAQECGASSLRLAVWEFNRRAVRFYEKMGMSTRNRNMEMIFRSAKIEK